MNCKQVQAALIEDLSHRADAEAAEHLRCCEPCRTLCDELLELEDLSRSLSGRFRVPPTFQSEVLAKAAQATPARRRRRMMAAVAITAAALVLALPWGSTETGARSGTYPDSAAVWSLDRGPVSRESPYVEVVVSGHGEEDVILRLPSVIEIHRSELQEEFYINNVSH
jgi:hypothetical protein